jgi:hypothetical protein
MSIQRMDTVVIFQVMIGLSLIHQDKMHLDGCQKNFLRPIIQGKNSLI